MELMEDLFDRISAEIFTGTAWNVREAKLIAKRKKRRRRWPNPAKRKAAYNAYLRSDKWQAFRMRILRERGAICEHCGNGCADEPHIHHLHYRTFKNERPQDVQVLCRRCHEKVHGRKS